MNIKIDKVWFAGFFIRKIIFNLKYLKFNICMADERTDIIKYT